MAGLMREAAPRKFLVTSQEIVMDAERRAASFASWYEMFPRSQSGDPAHHGTFKDVIRQLPRIAAMGFDVLYFPPIHPIGEINRKGRNNALRAGPGDPGSPYAIGSREGGHDALHPELGTLEDFQALIAAARRTDIEMALDFAIQCAPDHPWLSEHPDWFDWRPDGSLRYAENPPKKYEDIVNVDFYTEGRAAGSMDRAARRGAVLGRPGHPHFPCRQSAHQALSVLGMADRRHSCAPSGRDLSRRSLYPAKNHVPSGENRLLAILHLLHLAQYQDRRFRII